MLQGELGLRHLELLGVLRVLPYELGPLRLELLAEALLQGPVPSRALRVLEVVVQIVLPLGSELVVVDA